jgi:hypothetical protein
MLLVRETSVMQNSLVKSDTERYLNIYSNIILLYFFSMTVKTKKNIYINEYIGRIGIWET